VPFDEARSAPVRTSAPAQSRCCNLLAGDDTTYPILEAQIQAITAKRNDIAGQIIAMLEAAAFNNRPIDEAKAVQLIGAANDLLASISTP
jgi:hypothetical protein